MNGPSNSWHDDNVKGVLVNQDLWCLGVEGFCLLCLASEAYLAIHHGNLWIFGWDGCCGNAVKVCIHSSMWPPCLIRSMGRSCMRLASCIISWLFYGKYWGHLYSVTYPSMHLSVAQCTQFCIKIVCALYLWEVLLLHWKAWYTFWYLVSRVQWGHLPYFEVYVEYNNIQQLHHQCHLMTLGFQMCLLTSWHGCVQWWYEYICMLHKSLEVDQSVHKWHLVLLFSRLIIPLLIKLYYHLKYIINFRISTFVMLVSL